MLIIQDNSTFIIQIILLKIWSPIRLSFPETIHWLDSEQYQQIYGIDRFSIVLGRLSLKVQWRKGGNRFYPLPTTTSTTTQTYAYK
jgi:hypothetical protein